MPATVPYLGTRETFLILFDLLECYRRDVLGWTGTKEGYNDGNCGACAVKPITTSSGLMLCGQVLRCLARSGIDADDLVPVRRLLVGVGGPHEEWVVEKAADELHAHWETS